MARSLRGHLGAVVKHVASAADAATPSSPGITVLIYHRVGRRSQMAVDLPAAVFRDQMAELSDRVVSLDAALDMLSGAAAAPPGPCPVVVTFDDGTADVIDVALPILAEHRIPALLYVATAFIEDQRPFPEGGVVPSWSALSDAAGTGYLDLGSHTHTHALLDRLPAGEAADELDRSIELIGEHTGQVAHHFAYPKAVPGTSEVEALVRGRFRSAALAGTKPNHYGKADPWRLSRSPIQVSDEMRWFRAKADGGLRTEDALRRLANRVRYRGATT